jgi:hypothetical protein
MFPLGIETPQRPKLQDTKGTLEQLKESTLEGSKKIFNWFKNLFTNNKEDPSSDPKKKGLLATMMGPFVGFLKLMESLGKNKPEAGQTAESLNELQQQVGQTPEALAQAATTPTPNKTPTTSIDPIAKADVALARLRQKVTNEKLDMGSRILFAVELAMKENILGKHCWDWADKVYTIAGLPQSRRRIIFNSAGEHGLNCGNFPADDEKLNQLKPGDWVYTHNKNYKDFNGNHSMIFVEWIDIGKRIAKLASCHNSGQPGTFDQRYDFNKSPVVFISKPA